MSRIQVSSQAAGKQHCNDMVDGQIERVQCESDKNQIRAAYPNERLDHRGQPKQRGKKRTYQDSLRQVDIALPIFRKLSEKIREKRRPRRVGGERIYLTRQRKLVSERQQFGGDPPV